MRLSSKSISNTILDRREIFIESRAATVAWIKRIDKYYSYWMQCDRGAYSNDKSVHTIYEFSPSMSPGYKISERPTDLFTFQSSYGALQIWWFALWIKTDDFLIFSERSLLYYIYGRDNDKVICLFSMSKWSRLETFLLERWQIKNIRSSNRKKLTASNVKFLQSLGFIVLNIWNGWHLEYWRGANLSHCQDWDLHVQSVNITFGQRWDIDTAAGFIHMKAFSTSKEDWCQTKKMQISSQRLDVIE